MDAINARKNFEFINNIKSINPELDHIYHFDEAEQKRILNESPWKKDPHYFTDIKISAVALIKMVMHARSGGSIEVMGMMQGKVQGNTIIIMDAFALPVEGTETRVNAQAEGYEYMVQYMTKIKEVGRLENAIGWYHSHPGYGCWLSGIDVNTQMQNQQFQDPFVAVVIDPNRTISAGKVEIGAFRTYPEGYKAPDEGPSEYQTIPLSKIEDFGVHCKQYYPLEISHFKSTLDTQLLDQLWNKYWVNTLSQSPLLSNREYAARQMSDLAEKLQMTATMASRAGPGGFGPMGGPGHFPKDKKKKQEESQLSKITRDSNKISVEATHGLISQVLKNVLFTANPHQKEVSALGPLGDTDTILSPPSSMPQPGSHHLMQFSKTSGTTGLEGLEVLHDFVTLEEESLLIQELDSRDWAGKGIEPNPEMKRRHQHYGGVFSYRLRRAVGDMKQLPTMFDFLTQRLLERRIYTSSPNSIIVNEYEAGQGIMPHVDAPKLFGSTITALSLLSACVMTFQHVKEPHLVHRVLLRKQHSQDMNLPSDEDVLYIISNRIWSFISVHLCFSLT
ncbi:COP9 signalosome complex subunit 5a [Mortierella alpina]|nr:COP9 signalosome complex subunit 5a [Mortierella alpina]